MILRSQLSDFHQDHVKQNLNQYSLKLKEFMADQRSNGWTRAAQPVLAASAWLERKTRLRSVESHRRMALNTRLCMHIRRQELFRGVMAGLKAEFSGWIDFAQRAPELDLRLIFEAAGVAVAVREDSPNDAKRTLADNLWQCTDERPAIALNPSVPEVLVNHVLLHELFHLTHPKGQGHTVSGTPVEILADCFAGEMLQPAPAAQNLITTGVVEQVLNETMQSVLRHSRREAFEFVFEWSSGGHSLREVVVPAPPDYRDRDERAPSRDILSASLFGENCCEEVSFGVSAFRIRSSQPADALTVNCLTPDGLHLKSGFGEATRQALQDAGVIDVHLNTPMDLLRPGEERFVAAVQIPKIDLEGMQIGGAQYFCWWITARSLDVYGPEQDPLPVYGLIAIEDNGQVGPLALGLHPQVGPDLLESNFQLPAQDKPFQDLGRVRRGMVP